MTQLLVIKDKIREIYRKYDKVFIVVLKFVAALIVFTMLNKEIGYDERFTGKTMVLLLSGVSAVTPGAFMVFLTAVLSLVHIYAASKILAALFLVIIAILYFMFARYSPRYAWVVVAIPILAKLHLAYAVPLVLGLVATPAASLACIVGVVITSLIAIIKEAAVMAAGTTIAAEDILSLYTFVVKNLVSNKQMIAGACVCVVVLIITYFIRKLRIEHAFEIGLIVGTFSSIILSLVSGIVVGRSESTLFMILGTLASALIAYVVQFFRFVLDYSAIMKVQFDDDDFYYYVKAIPKIKVSSPEVNVKTIRSDDEEGGPADDVEETADGDNKDVF